MCVAAGRTRGPRWPTGRHPRQDIESRRQAAAHWRALNLHGRPAAAVVAAAAAAAAAATPKERLAEHAARGDVPRRAATAGQCRGEL